MSMVWPFFDLRVRTPLLDLIIPADDQIADLADRAVGNVLGGDEAHLFISRWAREPSPELQRRMLTWHWASRAQLTADHWRLVFIAYPAGQTEPVGSIDIAAGMFAARRSVSTGSWVLRDQRGRGYGRELRRAVLWLAFDGLGAREARSAADITNAPSNAVSRSLGYQPDGSEIVIAADGSPRPNRRWLLEADMFPPQPDITISGLGPCLPMLGL